MTGRHRGTFSVRNPPPMTHSIMGLSLHKAATSRTVVGLDIQPGKIVAAEVSVNGSVRLERAVTIDLPVGVVRDGEVVDIVEVTAALKELWSRHTGKDRLSREVRIGVANTKIVVRTVDAPPVTGRAEIDAVVRQLAASELPMPIDSAVLDYVPLGIVETPDGPRQRVVIIAARREMINNLLAAVTAAGLKPRGIDLSAFAMIRVLSAGPSESALYVSVGGVGSLAVVVDGACTFARVGSVSIEAMSTELAERMELTLEHARMWLRHVGLGVPVEEIDGDEEIVAQARAVLGDGTRRLASEIRTSLEFHQSQAVAGNDFEHAILTGAAVAIAGFADSLSAELGMPVQTSTVAAGTHFDGSVDLGSATVAAGLAVEEAPS